MEEELRNCKHYGPITTTTTTTITTTAPSTQTVIVLYPSPLLYKTIFSSPSRFVSCRLDRDRLPICASEKTFFSFSYSSHPLTHSFTPCFISTTPAGHAFQPHQPLHFLSTHDISIHPSSVDSPFRLHTLEDSTPLLTHSLTRSLYPPLHLFSVAAATACHFALPTYGMNQRGAVTKSTQLQTRDEDHATLCDPLAVAAGDAVCASLAFSITAPPPHTKHKTHSALQLNGARPPEPKRNCLIQYHM